MSLRGSLTSILLSKELADLYFRRGKHGEILHEMATACSPRDDGGKYPMWIIVQFGKGEHGPPHAHLYGAERKPSSKTLVTKFLITDNPPGEKDAIRVMKGFPAVPSKYEKMIKDWAKGKDKFGINNWIGLRRDWENAEKTFS